MTAARSTVTPDDSPDFRRLRDLLRAMPDGTLEHLFAKSERINLLVSPQQKAEIVAAAKKNGLTITEFITRSLSIVVDVLDGREPGKK